MARPVATARARVPFILRDFRDKPSDTGLIDILSL